MRQRLLAKRSAMDPKEYAEKSELILDKLKRQPEFRTADCIHCYVSMNHRNEVNTHPLINELIDLGKKVVVPVTNFESATLTHKYLSDFDRLKKNKWGVPEPVEGEAADINNLELVIVPMAGGDEAKNRLGYGKGFYDRFLKEASCPTFGLLFEVGMVAEIPTQKFDVPLSKLITEDRVVD